MKKYLFTFLFLATIVFGETYSDRLLVYVDNSVTGFAIDANTGRTNLEELNQEMDNIEATAIYQWLPNARPTDRDHDIYLNRYYVIQLSSSRVDIDDLVEEVGSLESILTSETMPIFRPTYIPNDPYWNQQWYLPNIEADEAYDLWDIDGGDIPGYFPDGEIVVAIADVGLDWDHPDLINNIWQNLGEDADGDGVVIIQNGNNWIFDPGDENGVDDDGDGYTDNFIGWDIAYNDNDPVPINNQADHGTLVAGCVSASTNNGTGIASVGWSVKLMGINNSNDATYITHGAQSILAAGQMGADVINMSWGSMSGCGGYQSVINTLYNTYGCILVGSAGNGGDDGNTNFDLHSPSSCNHVISVSATGQNDNFSCWATAGETVDLCAPGEAIRTTDVGGGTQSVSGTSFSAPITAGAVALVWSRYPDAEQEWVEERIIENTDEFSDMEGSCQGNSLVGMLGTGRLNVYKAIASAAFPSLSYQAYALQLTEDDGDGVLNPGESAKMRVILANGEGWANATNVTAILSSSSSYIDITDDYATFPDIVDGGTGVNIVDRFEFSIAADAPPADIPLTLTITAGEPPVNYQTVETFDLELSLNQSGFPFTTGGSIYSSPLIFDIDLDGADEIVFGSDDYSVYALGSDGSEEWSFATGNQVRGSAAAADLEGDGDIEIVFCSKDQKCYILNGDGSVQAEYSANGFLMTTPALRDLDGDGDLEIIFGGFAKYLYVIHHDGTDFGSFPLYVDESIMMAPAVGDIDNDGSDEIVVGTWSNNVWAFDLDGTVVSGFPYSAGNKINSDPALADLDGDGTLEILVGSDDNYLYSINSDGSERFSVNTSGDVRGAPSVEDIDGDGDWEIFFGSNVKKVFGIDHEGNALSGWPQESTSAFKSAPVFADLNNSGHPSILAATTNGTLYAWDTAGNTADNFPISLQGTVQGSFAVADIDSDGDLEISVGASSNMAVVDIKTDAGNGEYWSMYRLNPTRSGNRSDFEMGVEDNFPMLPTQFVVYQNYPNPFNPSTRIRYDLPEQSFVTITIHDLLGRNVRTLVKEFQDAGQQSVVWDGKNEDGLSLSTGIYFFQVHIPDGNLRTKKMMLLK